MRRGALLAALCLALAACAEAGAEHAGEANGATQEEVIPASYPEGPLYVGETLYYAEMGADRIVRVSNGTREEFFRQRGCGPTAIAPYGEGFLVLCHLAAELVAVDGRGVALRSWERDDGGRRLMDPNDASADGRGGVFFSDPGLFSRESRAQGFLMHLTADGALAAVDDHLWYPNGVFVDAAGGYVYVSEHMRGLVLRYRLEADGALGARETFANLAQAGASRYKDSYDETGPDGLEIGPNGELYVAQYGGGRILRFSPEGRSAGEIETAPRFITNIAFGPGGIGAITGPFENRAPPYRGEVRILSVERLTAEAD